jgi:multiple sugar transport system permease protein
VTIALARARQVVLWLLMAALTLLFLGPLLWFLALSLRPVTTDFTIPPTLWFRPSLWAFAYTFVQPGNNLSNLVASLIEAGGALAITAPLAILAAYGFSRYRFRGRRTILLWLLTLLLTPPITTLLPNYILMNSLGLVGSYLSLIILYQTFTIPLAVWLMQGFFRAIPVSLEEAAMVDGASRLRALWSVVLPVAAPGILVALTFAFVFSWNNAVFPLVLSSGPTQPLPIGTLDYFTTTGVTWNYIAATSIVTVLPPGILFFLFRKHLVKGLTFGAVTG